MVKIMPIARNTIISTEFSSAQDIELLTKCGTKTKNDAIAEALAESGGDDHIG